MDMNQQTDALTNPVGFAQRLTHLGGFEAAAARLDIRQPLPLDVTIPEALKTPIEALSRGIAAQVQVMDIEQMGAGDPRTKEARNRMDDLKAFRTR